MDPRIEKIADTIANSNIQEMNGEQWFQALPEDRKQASYAMSRAGGLKSATALVEAIDAKDVAGLEARLHSGNQLSRKAFTELTGIRLGTNRANTVAGIREFVGADNYAAHLAKCAANDLAAKETEAREAAEAKAAEVKAILAKFSDGITGDELVTLAYHFSIEIHPRTVSMLRKRVTWIKGEQAHVTGKGNIGEAWGVYARVSAAIEAIGYIEELGLTVMTVNP